jgi:PAS domain S-box-containing protein
LRELEELGKFAARAIWEDTVSFISWYRDGRLLTLNPSFEKLTGYSREELSGMRWPADFVTPLTRDSIIGAMEALDHGQITYHHDEELVRKDGLHLAVEVFVHKHTPPMGEEPFYYSFIVDISERKRLERSIERLATVVIDSNDAIILLDMNGKILEWNHGADQIYGYSREEALRMNIADIVPENLHETFLGIMEKAKYGQIVGSYETKRITKDGRVLDVWLTITALKDNDGKIYAIATTERDITERKHTEREMGMLLEEIRESHEELSAITYIMESTTATLNLSELLNGILSRLNGVLKADASGVFFKENGDVRAFASVGVEEEVNERYSMPVGKGFAGKIVQTRKPLYVEDAQTDPIVLSPFVKEKGVRSMLGVPLIINKDVVGALYVGWLGIHPVNEREQHLIQAIANSCASGILNAKLYEEAEDLRRQAQLYIDLLGHDINNMNQIGMGYLEMARDTLEKKYKIDEQDRVLLGKTLEALQNSSHLIDNVRKVQLIRSGEVKQQIIDLGAVISDVVSQYSHVQGRKVIINYTPVTGYYVRANNLLRDVFSNIIGNAIKHSPQEKPLTIDIDVAKSREKGTDHYKVSVADNGPGICDINKDELFTRFGRGKTKTSGRGLGLYLIKTLVESYHGKVWAEDRIPGDCSKGVKFIVMLPAVEK